MKQTPLDLSLFRWIESQTNETDRKALLSLRDYAMRPTRYNLAGR